MSNQYTSEELCKNSCVMYSPIVSLFKISLQEIGSNIFCDFRQAWKQLGDMEAEQAMQEYISCVNVLDPEGSTKVKYAICQPLSKIAHNM